MKPITIRYLSGHDVDALALDNDEILDAIAPADAAGFPAHQRNLGWTGRLYVDGNHAIDRLYEMARHCKAMLAYELLAGITAVRMRGQVPGDGVAAVISYFDAYIAPQDADRSPSPDVETILQHFESDTFLELTR